MDKFRVWAEQHPTVIKVAAGVLLLVAADIYRQAYNLAEGLEQIEASEFYGG